MLKHVYLLITEHKASLINILSLEHDSDVTSFQKQWNELSPALPICRDAESWECQCLGS